MAIDLSQLEQRLRRHVDMIAGVIGARNVQDHPGALEATARYIEDSFRSFGYTPAAQSFTAAGKPVRNIEVERAGSNSRRTWIVGAHYDSVSDCPAADDNASAVAGMLEVARWMADKSPRDSIRCVAFVNEEPPYYKSPEMGSWVYAKRCRERNENLGGVINLEMIGYYDSSAGSQRYPKGLDRFPLRQTVLRDRGDFIAFVGDLRSFWLTRRVNRLFRKSIDFPSTWIAGPPFMGSGMSDHWSFWQHGYRAVMVTDTSFFRNPHYHRATDRPDTLDYASMAKVVAGLAKVVEKLSG